MLSTNIFIRITFLLEFNYAFKASTGILFKSVKRFTGCLCTLIVPTFCEYYNSLHQNKKHPDTVSS